MRRSVTPISHDHIIVDPLYMWNQCANGRGKLFGAYTLHTNVSKERTFLETIAFFIDHFNIDLDA